MHAWLFPGRRRRVCVRGWAGQVSTRWLHGYIHSLPAEVTDTKMGSGHFVVLTGTPLAQDTSSIDDVIYAEYRLAAAMKGQRRHARANDEGSATDAVLSRGIAALKPKGFKAQ